MTRLSDEAFDRAAAALASASQVTVLSGAGMSTAAGIPDFRSPGGLYSSSAALLERFTYLDRQDKGSVWQRARLEDDVKSALTLNLFSVNPLPYHEMRRGFILGLGAGQWKCTIGHLLPLILDQKGKLRMLASQNIDGLDHKLDIDPKKLFNPHGLMSTLVAEAIKLPQKPLCTDPMSPIYQRYMELVQANIKDIYAGSEPGKGDSSRRWPRPEGAAPSKPITLKMFRDLLPEEWGSRIEAERESEMYSVKPGSVLFDRHLWQTTADGKEYDWHGDVKHCDLVLVMGTSLSGLTVDAIAHSAGPLGKPRIVFDMTDAPKKSIGRSWDDNRDCFVQGSLDESVLKLLSRLGWLEDLIALLPQLCLKSLELLGLHAGEQGWPEEQQQQITQAIAAELERERTFHCDSADLS